MNYLRHDIRNDKCFSAEFVGGDISFLNNRSQVHEDVHK